MIGIYKITSPSGKVYIGESKNIESRWKSYRFYDCKSQAKLYNSFKKYGVENHKFEVLMECAFEDLKYFESCFQEIYRVVDKGLNLKYTGRGDLKGRVSLETILKQKESAINRFKKTEEIKKFKQNHQSKKDGYVNPMKGKTMSKEACLNMSISQKKLYDNGYINPNKGKKVKPESIEKMKKTKKEKIENGWVSPKKGKKCTIEQIEKNRRAQLKAYSNGRIAPISKPVINTQNGFIYDSATEALKSSGLKVTRPYFTRMLQGVKKNKTNYEYIDNIN